MEVVGGLPADPDDFDRRRAHLGIAVGVFHFRLFFPEVFPYPIPCQHATALAVAVATAVAAANVKPMAPRPDLACWSRLIAHISSRLGVLIWRGGCFFCLL